MASSFVVLGLLWAMVVQIILSSTPSNIEPHVVAETAARGDYPYIAVILPENKTRFYFSGSLISRDWVLTAARTIKNYQNWTIYLGAFVLDDKNVDEAGRIILTSHDAILYEKWLENSPTFDIGLIRLPYQVVFNEFINVIALPPKSFKERDFAGKIAQVAGWGSNWKGEVHPKLHYVDMKITTQKKCKEYFDMLSLGYKGEAYCAQSTRGYKGPCGRDTGAALVMGKGKNATIIGVFSQNWFWCDNDEYFSMPTLYAAVPHYLDWISEKTGLTIE